MTDDRREIFREELLALALHHARAISALHHLDNLKPLQKGFDEALRAYLDASEDFDMLYAELFSRLKK